MTLFAFNPAPQQGGSDPMGSMVSTLIMFGSIILIFYFMMIRPQQKRQKEMKAMLDSMKTGDNVVTSSGMHGKIAEIDNDDNSITLIVSENNTRIKFDKAAIATVLKKEKV